MSRQTLAIVLLVAFGLCGNVIAQTAEKTLTDTVANSIGMRLVLIPAGEFMMGNRESAAELAKAFDWPAGNFASAYPYHRVRITKPFYLGAYEVTVGQFRQFVGDTGYKTDVEKSGKGGYGYSRKSSEHKAEYTWRNAGFAQTDEHPVVNVSWNDAVAFCEWLSRKEGKMYRLPTEAEWEYACRAGTTTRFYSGDDPEALAQVGNVADATMKAWFSEGMDNVPTPIMSQAIKASDGYVFTAPVGRFRPNAFSVYDMHGNVWEWCADLGSSYYAQSPIDDPPGPSSGRGRVLRGGSWRTGAVFLTSACRNGYWPDAGECTWGFRVARTP